MKTTTEKFKAATVAHIKEVWVKFKNPLFPRQSAKYPGRVADFIHVEIGGKRRLFRVQIEESKQRS